MDKLNLNQRDLNLDSLSVQVSLLLIKHMQKLLEIIRLTQAFSKDLTDLIINTILWGNLI